MNKDIIGRAIGAASLAFGITDMVLGRKLGRGIGAGEVVEEEHVHHDRALRLPDQPKDFIENLLIAMAHAGRIDIGDVGQQRCIAGRGDGEIPSDACGQRFVDLPGGREQVASQERQQQAFAGAPETFFRSPTRRDLGSVQNIHPMENHCADGRMLRDGGHFP